MPDSSPKQVLGTLAQNTSGSPKNIAKKLDKLRHAPGFIKALREVHNEKVEKNFWFFIVAPFLEYLLSTGLGGTIGTAIKEGGEGAGNFLLEVIGKSFGGALCFTLVNLGVCLLKNYYTKSYITELTEEALEIVIDKAIKSDETGFLYKNRKKIMEEYKGLKKYLKEHPIDPHSKPNIKHEDDFERKLYEKVRIKFIPEMSQLSCYYFFVGGLIFSGLNWGLSVIEDWDDGIKYPITALMRSVVAATYPTIARFGFWFEVPVVMALITGELGFNSQTATEAFFHDYHDYEKAWISAAIAGAASIVPQIAIKAYDYFSEWWNRRPNLSQTEKAGAPAKTVPLKEMAVQVNPDQMNTETQTRADVITSVDISTAASPMI